MSEVDVLSFTGEYRWLSNFTPGSSPVALDGQTYPTVEAAYQAAKTTDPALRVPFTTMNPGQAKRAGKRLVVRPDWEHIKVGVMQRLLFQKFMDPEMCSKLLATGDRRLIEGNDWGDTFWGVCDGVGDNVLGTLLMEIRDSLRDLTQRCEESFMW